jgi:hypothetical protein
MVVSICAGCWAQITEDIKSTARYAHVVPSEEAQRAA